ncbi:MAG: hypothetical protein ACOVS5_17840 [Oligoflexus sp.]
MILPILCGIIIVPKGRKRVEMNLYRSLSVRRSAVAKLRAMSAFEDRSMCRVLELAIDDRIASYPAQVRKKVEEAVMAATGASLEDSVGACLNAPLNGVEKDGQDVLAASIDFVDSIDLDVKFDQVDMDMSSFVHFDERELKFDIKALDSSPLLRAAEDNLAVDIGELVPADVDCDLDDLPFLGLDVAVDELIKELDRGA